MLPISANHGKRQLQRERESENVRQRERARAREQASDLDFLIESKLQRETVGEGGDKRSENRDRERGGG